MVIVFFAVATLFFFFSGVSFLYVTTFQYVASSDSYVEYFFGEYRPFGYGIIGLAMISLLIAVAKGMDRLGAIHRG